MSARITLCVLLALISGASLGNDACPAPELSRAEWSRLQSHDFAFANARDANRAALALLPCLDAPDPKVRDALAYEALSTWMRGKQISVTTAREMLQRLTTRLKAPDASGFGRPFAALVLAEVARMDRIDAYLTRAEYSALVVSASEYLQSVRDYRGFDEREGWRHGVAHGADLLMQLALNPRTTKQEATTMLAAIATQVAPSETHAYIFGESERLARPVLFIAQRAMHSSSEWNAWLATITSPAPFAQWDETFTSQRGLAKRHNTHAFLNALHTTLAINGDDRAKAALLQPLSEAIAKLQ